MCTPTVAMFTADKGLLLYTRVPSLRSGSNSLRSAPSKFHDDQEHSEPAMEKDRPCFGTKTDWRGQVLNTENLVARGGQWHDVVIPTLDSTHYTLLWLQPALYLVLLRVKKI